MEKENKIKMKNEVKDLERELVSLIEKTLEMEHEINKVVLTN